MRSHLATRLVALAAVALVATSPAGGASRDEIRSVFTQFVAAQNAHDLRAAGELISDSPDVLWITPGHVERGRDAALHHFADLFHGTWRVDPDWSTLQVLMLNIATAELFVRVTTIDDGTEQSTQLDQILVKTKRGWRVLSIVDGAVPPK